MEELVRKAQVCEPLWVPTSNNSHEILSEDEYVRSFPRGIGPKLMGFKSEASRESMVVSMNHMTVVEILMDVHQWSNVFSGIVSRAMTLEVLSTGVAGNYNGALQVMRAEYQIPSPLVPTRENYFVRYCKQHGDGTWAVVDVSMDNMGSSSISRFRRRPSGCLIQELLNGYSKVTWIEHVEVDNGDVHDIYKVLVNSGLAFGEKRWVATLDRQSERLASAMASNIPAGDVGGKCPIITSPKGRKSMLKLAERMVLSFCSGVGASTAHTWTSLSGSGGDDWDILSNCGHVEEIAHIANGRDPGNCVSLLRVNVIQIMFALLPSGFAILPDGLVDDEGGALVSGTGGSLLTIAFQILVDSDPTSKLSLGSVAIANSLIKSTVERIKVAVASNMSKAMGI
ncbi:unnamed protein product [Lactuca saligna]|uniref:START domain-containing protein n=1 Tax=Lactuca saligna TaxID=75948 RepID=A0AA35ZI64_LACSI|nr:unnamed protein product [Lactuca saligna]